MSIKVKDLGNYYKLAREVGYDYIRTGEEHVAGATTCLTVKSISLCENAEDDLLVFLQVLKIFTEKYNNNPIRPTVEMLELEKSNMFTLSQVDRVSLLIAEEVHLKTGARSSQGKNFTFAVAPSILEFEKVETIRDYLRAQESFKSEDESESRPRGYPIETIELAEGGIVVTPSLTEKEFDYDLFISYSSKDQDVADAIDSALDEVDLVTFLAPKDIDSGDIGSEQIRKALLNSAEVAVLMSPNSINSLWVITEWGAAWVLRKRITPILLECKIEDIPKLLQDMQKRDYPSEIDRFIKEALKRKTNEP